MFGIFAMNNISQFGAFTSLPNILTHKPLEKSDAKFHKTEQKDVFLYSKTKTSLFSRGFFMCKYDNQLKRMFNFKYE